MSLCVSLTSQGRGSCPSRVAPVPPAAVIPIFLATGRLFMFTGAAQVNMRNGKALELQTCMFIPSLDLGWGWGQLGEGVQRLGWHSSAEGINEKATEIMVVSGAKWHEVAFQVLALQFGRPVLALCP